jgi:peptidoglycan/LPS O-acetylase OafA/YrhL
VDHVMIAVGTTCLIVLLLNIGAALFAFVRRGFSEDWLLVVLLSGTTGAAVVALLIVLAPLLADSPDPPFRLVDVAVILTGTAALTAAVRAAAGARTREDARAGHDSSGSTASRGERS